MARNVRFLWCIALTVVSVLGVVSVQADAVVPVIGPNCGGTCAHTADMHPDFKGWGLVHNMCQSVGFTPSDYARVGMGWAHMGAGMCATNVGALASWKWSGSSWSATTGLSDGEWVYIWPWGNGWSWTWTRRNGYTATRSEHLVICADPNSTAPPVVTRCSPSMYAV